MIAEPFAADVQRKFEQGGDVLQPFTGTGAYREWDHDVSKVGCAVLRRHRPIRGDGRWFASCPPISKALR